MSLLIFTALSCRFNELNQTVASLTLVSPGAATDDATYFFLKSDDLFCFSYLETDDHF